jgi:hypothetical protein
MLERKALRLCFIRDVVTSHRWPNTLVSLKTHNLLRICSRRRSLSTNAAKFDFNPTGPCRVLEWAAFPENRAAASECLNAPSLPPTSLADDTITASSGILNWEEYWSYRNWNFPKTLKDDTEREYGHALAAHIMTAPMTIYSMLDPLLEAGSKVITSTKEVTNTHKNNKEKTATMKVRWCIIGARSEASLPIQYWQEMLDMIHAARLLAFHKFSMNAKQNMNNKRTPLVPKILEITLDFIGPEMNIQPSIVLHPSKSLRHDEYDFVGDDTTTNIFTTCTLQWRYKGLYHTHYNEINEQEDVYDKQYDAYILFNPGIGHPYLQKLWQPTLQLIFEQFYRIRNTLNGGCTILLTSHSMTDALRDSKLLQQYLVFAEDYNTDQYITTPTANVENESSEHHTEEKEEEEQQQQQQEEEIVNYYTENPFASRIYYQDPMAQEQFRSPHVVRPNHYVALLRRR